MTSEDYSISFLDPRSTFRLFEEISSLLCIDRPEFGPLFGEDHRKRVEDDAEKEEEEVRGAESNDKKMEKVGRRGLLTVVASTSTGRIVAHACIIASPGQASLTL